jgi:phospholipid/cholesterol/gamma-HCH transport system permease protein
MFFNKKNKTILCLYNLFAGLSDVPFKFKELVRQVHFRGIDSLAMIFFTPITTGMVRGLRVTIH